MYQGSDFTLVELKEAPRDKGLPTGGTKTKLIQRLEENDPNVWTSLSERQEALSVADASNRDQTIGADAAEDGHEWVAAAREGHGNVLSEGLEVRGIISLAKRERENCRREREADLVEGERIDSRSTVVACINGHTYWWHQEYKGAAARFRSKRQHILEVEEEALLRDT